MQGLVNSNKESKGVLDGDEIAQKYQKWMLSPPFDIGFTTTNALGGLKYKPLWSTAEYDASSQNKNSLSNGGLMRMTPLSVWASNISDPAKHFAVVKAEQSMTHPNIMA